MIILSIKRHNKSTFMLLVMFLLILSSFSIIQTPGAYEIGEDLDQTQGEENYGYWFDDTVFRWQEFKPLYSTLTRLDLNVDKIGNPGNMLINITNGHKSLWNTTVLEANITSGATWVNITLESALPLIPERSYYIYVRSDEDSTSTSNRYTWDGHLNSNYTRGVSSIAAQPHFDFTFVTWSLSNDRDIYLDQVQNGVNYGYWFEKDVIRWQEFKPLYTTLTQLDLYIHKDGNPGNLLVNITDGQRTLWQVTVLEADVVGPWGWVNISIDPALPLIPEQSYYIYVGSDTDSHDVDNRYFWSGSTVSNYYRGKTSIYVNPPWDFAFRMWSTPCETATYLDNAQEGVNYGFAFTNSWNAWQEFKPISTALTQLDLNIQRLGDPGNVLVNITDGQSTLWNTTILEAEIPAPGGWVTISFLSPLCLIPGNSYYIYVQSVDPMVSGSDYYAWMGHIVSNYTRGDTNVQLGWPTYDYAFRTWTQSSDINGFLDQVQDSVNDGLVLGDAWNAWQEFKPFYSTLTQLDLYFERVGDPGNVLVNITDGQTTLFHTSILEADIQAPKGWVNLSLPAPLPLISDSSYYIHVRSEDPYVPVTDYYFWKGHTISNYTRGDTNVQAGRPTFDYAFITTSLFCDRSAYLDQVQDGVVLSEMFDENWVHWQEFTPVYDTLTQLDLYITKSGNPGNVLINITDGQDTLWQTTVLPTDITINGWVNISVPASLHLIPGRTYNISVCSDAVSPGPTDRYFWTGTTSNYYRGISSLEGSDPGFDFGFRAWGQYDMIPPEITVTSPTNQAYSSSSIWLNFTVNEPTSWINYSLDGATNVTITENTLLDSLSEGSHNATIYTSDLAGNNGSYTIDWFAVDTLDPIITLSGPMNITYTTTEAWIEFTIDEPTSWIGYSLDGAANETITGNTLLRSLSEGSHNVVIFARDLVGNTGETSIVWFTVIIPEPEPTTTLPPLTTEPIGDTTTPTTTEPESSTTSAERPSVSTPGFSVLLAGFAVLSVLVLLRRKH